jgi:hypothetical protein
MEFFVECGCNRLGADIGLFGKWEYLRARGSLETSLYGNAAFNDSADIVFDRQAWVLGGKFALGFSSPL